MAESARFADGGFVGGQVINDAGHERVTLRSPWSAVSQLQSMIGEEIVMTYLTGEEATVTLVDVDCCGAILVEANRSDKPRRWIVFLHAVESIGPSLEAA